MQNFESGKPLGRRDVFYSTWWCLPAMILPLFSGWLFRVPRLVLDNFTDAVFYLSYAQQFSELVDRYGFPYYATRFGAILPDALFGHLFGETAGILVLRWLLSSLVSLALFLFFRKMGGGLAGVIASLLWSLNPVALRLLCTTYVDSTSVPFMILGALLLASSEGGVLVSVISGVLFGMAASAHLYAAFALTLLTPWMLGALWGNKTLMIRSLIWSFIGCLGTVAVGWLWYWVVWDMPALLSPTIELMQQLGGGQAGLWKKPLGSALRDAPVWFAPLALLPALLLAAITGTALIRGAALSLLASSLFFWGGDLLGKAYVLSMPFYFSFLFPVTLLASATLCAELIAKHIRVWGVILLAIAGLILGWGLTCYTGMFSQILGHYPAQDLTVVELGLNLAKQLPKASQDGKTLRFWADDDPAHKGGTDNRMIEAFWLHPFGRLVGDQGKSVPFPQMSGDDAALIGVSGVGRIVVFDQDPNRVEEALEKAKAAHLPFFESRRFTLVATNDPKRSLNVALLDGEPYSGIKSDPIPLKQLRIYQGGVVSPTNAGIKILSSDIKGWDFAALPLGSLSKGDSLVIRCRVEKGMIRFALHNKGSHAEPNAVVECWPTDKSQQLVLTASQSLENAEVTLRSLYPRGSRSAVVIEAVYRTSPTVP